MKKKMALKQHPLMLGSLYAIQAKINIFSYQTIDKQIIGIIMVMLSGANKCINIVCDDKANALTSYFNVVHSRQMKYQRYVSVLTA